MYFDWFALGERLPLLMFIDIILLLIIAGNKLFKGVPMYGFKMFLSVLSGLLLSVSWSPSPFVFPIFFALVPLLVVVHSILVFRAENLYRTVFWYVYLTFLVWNVCTTWWVSNSTLAGGMFAVFVNSFLMTLPFLLFVFMYKSIGNKAYFALPLYFISFEYLHHHWDMSWPWLTLGNVFSENIQMVQWYEFTGVFGGSLWVLSVNFFLFYIITFKKWNERRLYFLGYALMVLIPVFFSYYLYFNYEESGKRLVVAAIQPNIDPWNEKFDETTEMQQLDNLILLSKNAIESDKVDILLWPETALPFGIWVNKERFFENTAIQYIRQALLQKYPQVQLITGISAYEHFENPELAPYYAIPYKFGSGKYAAYNSIVMIDSSHTFQHYIKSKLVVGTESMPFYKYLKNYMAQAMISLGGTSITLGTQEQRSPLYAKSGTLASIVCYESIYGDFLKDFYNNNAQALLISTNDAWWGNTAGYKQHNAYARFRAVEARKNVVRSANTGKSSFIDQRGNEVKSTEYNTKGYLCGEILMNNKKTFYIQNGDYIARVSLIISLITILLAIIQILNFYIKK